MTTVVTNRRSYYRQPMYQRITLRAAGARVAVPATLVDISGGGCCLHVRTMLQGHIDVEFDLARASGPPLRLAGKIRKASYTASDHTFRYAVEWKPSDKDAHDQLLRFISEEQRRNLTGAKRVSEEFDLNPPARPSTRLREQRAHRRVEVNMPVRCAIAERPGSFSATAVDVSAGGVRIIASQVLRQEWSLTLTFTLPSEPLRVYQQLRGSQATASKPFEELRVLARPLPGVKQSRGRFVHSMQWVNPDPQDTRELNRFVQVVQLTSAGRR